jgi:hypothetical protein
MKAIIKGRRYDTETATQIASDRYFDGHNWERRGRNTYLYKTARGNYFVHYSTCWQGEHDRIEALSPEDAMQMYESLPEHEVEDEEAFPGQSFEDA